MSQQRDAGKRFRQYLEFIARVKAGQTALVQGVDFVVMSRNYFENLESRPTARGIAELEASIAVKDAALRSLLFMAAKLWDEAKPIKDGPGMRVTHPIIEKAKEALSSDGSKLLDATQKTKDRVKWTVQLIVEKVELRDAIRAAAEALEDTVHERDCQLYGCSCGIKVALDLLRPLATQKEET